MRTRLRQLRSNLAARVFLVLLLAFVVASLLNADGLYRTARTQSPGLRRDVSVWLARRLVSVSRSVHLDRPRHELQVAIGRSTDDVIDTRVALTLPSTPHAPSARKAKPGPKRVHQPRAPARHRERYTAPHPLRVWVAGDSLAEVPGQSLERLTGTKSAVDVVGVESRLATGLTRPDIYNWFTRIQQAISQLHPRVAVLSFGADDAHDYMSGVPAGGTVGPIGSASWGHEYLRRAAGVTRELNAAGIDVIWLGIPISASPPRNVRFRFVDHILSSIAKADPAGASYIDAYSMFARGGQYHAYLRDAAGELVLMRAADGIHYTAPAGDLVAGAVLERLSRLFVLKPPPAGS